jgi:hypothetical protein
MISKNRSLISGFATALLVFSGSAFAANTSCNFNIKTGKLEASEEWKIALGKDADRTCEGSTLGVKNKNPPPQLTNTTRLGLPVAEQEAIKTSTQMHFPPPTLIGKAPEFAEVAPVPQMMPAAPSVRTSSSSGFAVQKADGNIRTTIQRWAVQGGWVFDAEHWTIGEDITITGVSAGAQLELGNDFKTAVKTLLASTALTEQEIKPCFYSNKVLRIVYVNQKCDRTHE